MKSSYLLSVMKNGSRYSKDDQDGPESLDFIPDTKTPGREVWMAEGRGIFFCSECPFFGPSKLKSWRIETWFPKKTTIHRPKRTLIDTVDEELDHISDASASGQNQQTLKRIKQEEFARCRLQDLPSMQPDFLFESSLPQVNVPEKIIEYVDLTRSSPPCGGMYDTIVLVFSYLV